jgi:hypothetical protein
MGSVLLIILALLLLGVIPRSVLILVLVVLLILGRI